MFTKLAIEKAPLSVWLFGFTTLMLMGLGSPWLNCQVMVLVWFWTLRGHKEQFSANGRSIGSAHMMIHSPEVSLAGAKDGNRVCGGEVRSSTIRVAVLPSPSARKKLTGDGDGKREGGELEGNHGELGQGVIRLERLVAAGGKG